MAIADRPILTPGPSAIQPYLSAGTSRAPGRRAPWEDELDKLLLGIPQSEWAGIRGSLGLAPGGGYAPGGGGGAVTGGGGASAAPAAAFAAPAAAEGLRVGSVAPDSPNGAGEGGAGGMGEFGGYGQTNDVLGVLGNMASFATGPLGFAANFMATAINDPTRTSVYGLADLFGGGGGSSGAMSLSDAEQAFGGGVNSSQPLGGADRAAAMDPQMAQALAEMGMSMGGGVSMGQSEAEAAAAGAQAGSPGSDGFGGNSQAWMSGGYTGAGDDGRVQPDMPAGTVHEGELVLNANAVAMLPPQLLALLGALNQKGRDRMPPAEQ